jgi:serine/threonine-protein kinase
MTLSGGALVGKTIAGVRLDAVLGESDASWVFRGVAVGLVAAGAPGAPRALRLVTPASGADGAVRIAIIERATLLGQIRHANVERFYGVREDNVDGQPVLAMELELVDGDTLAAELTCATAALPLTEALAWVADAATGVAAGHALGLVHGDLRPANVARTSTGAIKVTGFGLADALAAGRRAPAYAAPEVLAGGVATPAADVYALGVILTELLFGYPPYAASGDAAHPTGPMRRPGSPRAPGPRRDVPAAVLAVITRATARDRAERYANASELASALRDSVTPAVRGLDSLGSLAAVTARPPPSGVGQPPPSEGGHPPPSAVRPSPRSDVDPPALLSPVGRFPTARVACALLAAFAVAAFALAMRGRGAHALARGESGPAILPNGPRPPPENALAAQIQGRPIEDLPPAPHAPGDDVASIVQTHAEELERACRDRAPSGSMSATIDVQITIGRSGNVTRAVATGDDAAVARCVEEKARGWTFPSAARDRDVSLPFRFAAR